MLNKIFLTFVISSLITLSIFINTSFPFVIIIGVSTLFLVHKYLEESMVLFALLFPFNNLIIFKMLIADVRLLQILWIVILTVLFFKITLRYPVKFTIKFEKYDLFFLIFLTQCVIQFFVLRYPILTLREMIQWTHYFSIFIVLRSLFKEKQYITKFYKGIGLVTIIFVFFALYKLALGVPPIKLININVFGGGIMFIDRLNTLQQTSTGSFSFSRVSSFFWGSVGTANMLMIMYFLNFIKQTQMKTILRFVIIVLLIATASRAAWIIFYILFLINAFVEKKLWSRLALSLFGLFLFALIFPWMIDRFMDTFSMDEGSNRYHVAIWAAAIEMFRSHMVLGVGTGHFIYSPILMANLRMYNLPEFPMTPHNIFLKILAENGIFGFTVIALFSLYIIKLVIANLGHYRYSPQRYVLLAFIATSLMNLTMNAVMIEAFWILLALSMSTKPDSKKKETRRIGNNYAFT